VVAPTSNQPYVFLSYASAERERALHLADLLETRGISVWIDRKSIVGGTSWTAEIVEGIKGCGALLVLVSAAALSSPNVQQELQLAWEHRRPLLPLRLDATPLPSTVEYVLAGRQWVDVLDQPEGRWLPEVLRAFQGLTLRPSAAAPTVPDLSLPASALPLASDPPPRRNNLPVEVTSFVGREQELKEARDLLATSHLLTLTGTGGCGKTRLALKLAETLLDDFPEGVWLVELAPLTEPSLVPPAVARAIGVHEIAGRDLPSVLVDALRARRVLLVLDNCEHLLDACAQLVDALLRGCPEVRILATSREVLGIGGEVSRRVPSLELPADQSVPLERLIQSEAVRLFVERARLVQPGFGVTEPNASAITQICRRLDGIPLAIELAAARLRAFSVEQIASRLDQRFRLLTGGSRAALPRQQTLVALVGWSYDLLSPQQRLLFDRLSVFAGGWTLEAAEAIGAGGVIANEEVLDLLSQLVDKSLVLMEPTEADGAVRFRLLETLRQYGQERLLASGEAAAARGRHLAWYLALAERAEAALHGPDQVAWLNRLDVEHDNFRGALAWSQDPNAVQSEIETTQGPLSVVEAGLRLAVGIHFFWFLRVHRREGWRWLEAGLAHSAHVGVATRARALLAGGYLGVDGGAEPERGLAFLEESLDLFRSLDDKEGIARAMGIIGNFLPYSGDLPRARALGSESVARARELGNDRLLCSVLHSRVFNPWVLDDQARRALAEESLALAQKLGDILGIAISNRILGEIALGRGEYDRARRYFAEDLTRTRILRDTVGIIVGLRNVGDLASLTEDYPQAGRCYDEARRLLSDIGYSRHPLYAAVLWRLGRLAVLQDDAATAEERFKQGLAIDQAAGYRPGIGRCLAGLASVAERQRKVDQAARLLAAASSLRGDAAALWERAEIGRLTNKVAKQLSDATFAAAWAAGQALTLEQAIAAAGEDGPD
jgi:predicted ATPase